MMARASIKKSTVSKAAVAERKLVRDAQRQSAQQTKDSYQNAILKLGLGSDNPLSASTYGFNPITRNRTLCEWMYRGSWMGGIAVDIPADDMTRAGIEINSKMPPEQMDTLKRAEVDLDLWGKTGETIKWANLYGGCIMVALIDGQDVSTPLRRDLPIVKDQLKGFLVLDRWMIEPRLEDLVSELGPDLGQPKFYRVNSDAPALRGKNIHYSRCLRLIGVDLPYWQRVQENLWGISVFERIYDRMVALDSATQGSAQLVYKSFLRTYKMKGMTNLMSMGGDDGIRTVMRKMDMVRRYQNNEGLTVIDAEDDVTAQTSNAFTGISEVILQMAQQLSGTLQIPLVRMFGQSPAGLNSTGESDLRTYYDGIAQKQERMLRLPLDWMYRLIAQSKGIVLPADFSWTFRPLWQMDEIQKSEVSARDATSIAEMTDLGIIDRPTALRELKQNSRTTGRFDNITDEMITEAEQEPDDVGIGGKLGLSDDEIRAAGGDPDKVKHKNPNNPSLPSPADIGPSAGSSSKPSPFGDAMMGGKDKPTYYKIVTNKGEVLATVSKSKVMQTHAQMQKERGEKLEMVLVQDTARTRDSLPSYHVCGVQVSIENMKGSVRTGPGWSVVMPADYGYIPTVDSAEGDMEWMDCYVGPNRDSEQVWVFDMVDPRTGQFDEHKCLLGFDSIQAATACIQESYNDGGMQRVMGKTPMTAEEFKAWLRSGDHKRPVHKLRAVS